MGFGSLIGGIGGAVFGGPAGAAVGASIGGAFDGAASTSKANKRNQEMSREQMLFQERMSNTAYQRSMKDLDKAGLNPMLAFQQGGASSPSGSQATATPELTTDSINGLINSAVDSYKKSKENKLLEAKTNTEKTVQELNSASAKATRARAEKEEATVPLWKRLEDLTTSAARSSTSKQIKKDHETIKKHYQKHYKQFKNGKTPKGPTGGN